MSENSGKNKKNWKRARVKSSNEFRHEREGRPTMVNPYSIFEETKREELSPFAMNESIMGTGMMVPRKTTPTLRESSAKSWMCTEKRVLVISGWMNESSMHEIAKPISESAGSGSF